VLEELACCYTSHHSAESLESGTDEPVLSSATHPYGHSARRPHDPATCPVCQALANLKWLPSGQPMSVAALPPLAECVATTPISLPSLLPEDGLAARAPPPATSLAAVS